MRQWSTLRGPATHAGGHHEHLGARVDERARELGEPQVVAGHQADLPAAEVDHDAARSARPSAGRTRGSRTSRRGGPCGTRPSARAAHDQGVVGPGRVVARSRTCRRRRWCRARRPPARPRVANGPSSGSAYALTSEPASPKSRANASGKTTRSASSGASSVESRRGWPPGRARRPPGPGRPAASVVVVTPPACHPIVRRSAGARCETRACDRPGLSSFCAVVLAGGRAARLGGADKAVDRGRRPHPARARARRGDRRRRGGRRRRAGADRAAR